eukprot:7107043-Pyramimonas_sp.AAC.1
MGETSGRLRLCFFLPLRDRTKREHRVSVRGRENYPYPRPRGRGPWAAIPWIRGVCSRMPRAERIQ